MAAGTVTTTDDMDDPVVTQRQSEMTFVIGGMFVNATIKEFNRAAGYVILEVKDKDAALGEIWVSIENINSISVDWIEEQAV